MFFKNYYYVINYIKHIILVNRLSFFGEKSY